MIDPELALQIVRTSPVIAYDTEATGLDTVRDDICGYVITDHSFSIYVPVRHSGGGNIPHAEEFEKELADAFNERSRLGYRTVGHHLGFDLRLSAKRGVIPWSPLEDTMINEALIDDRTEGYSLEDCCRRHQVTLKLGTELYAELARRFGGIPDKKQMQHFHKLPGDLPVAVEYATGDGVSTLELWGSQQPLLDAEELRVPWQLECDLLPYLARIHRRGIRIDHDYAEKVLVEIKTKTDEAKAKFSPGFNVRSPKEVEELYRLNGYTDDMFDRTEKGAPSFTEKWLETNEIGEAILSVRRLEKAKDSFVTPLTETNNLNGRVFPILNQSKSDDYGVAGARLSCSTPNLQAYPKRNKEVGAIVRKLVIPDAGRLLEEGDAMQQEPRFFTHYSRDPRLLEGYRNNTLDIHDLCNALLMLDDRDKAKRLAMGMLTMLGLRELASRLRCSYGEAKDYKAKFLDDAFPAIRDFQQLVIDVFKRRGYVKSILGRKARLESPRFAYRGVSRVIQNSGGDHIKTCILRACQYEDAYPDDIQVLLSIHDSVLWQRDPGHDVKEFVRMMENVPHEPQFNLLVPIPFEVGSGDNWAEASYMHKIPGNGRELKGKKGWTY